MSTPTTTHTVAIVHSLWSWTARRSIPLAPAVRLVPSLLASLDATLVARLEAARRRTNAAPTFCDGCQVPRLDVRDCGLDADGSPDAPALCPVCRQATRL